uniref:Uncharacterized protein n=1 Tax=Oryza barthii TaxID=65489 RepID=A0A0D3HA29_9ORYZ
MQIHGRAVQAASHRTRAGARQVMHDRFQQVQGFRTSTPSGRDANVPAGEGILCGGPPHYPQEGRSAKKDRHPAPTSLIDRPTISHLAAADRFMYFTKEMHACMLYYIWILILPNNIINGLNKY